jgi:hypothetical protein
MFKVDYLFLIIFLLATVFCKKSEKIQVDAQGNKTYRAPKVRKDPSMQKQIYTV